MVLPEPPTNEHVYHQKMSRKLPEFVGSNPQNYSTAFPLLVRDESEEEEEDEDDDEKDEDSDEDEDDGNEDGYSE